jgi:hypothetical protein
MIKDMIVNISMEDFKTKFEIAVVFVSSVPKSGSGTDFLTKFLISDNMTMVRINYAAMRWSGKFGQQLNKT